MVSQGFNFSAIFTELPKYTYPAGQQVCGPHDPSGVYFIHDGYAKAYDITSAGDTQLISYYGPGDVFPFYWAFNGGDQEIYHEALGPLVVSRVQQPLFAQKINQDNALLQSTVQYLLRMYRFYQLRIQNLELQAATERVAFRLIFLSEYFGIANSQGNTITVPTIYQDIADSVGLTRDTVSRIMSSFIQQKLIARRGKRITILRHSDLAHIYAQ